jgi:NADH dehydrogenase
MDSTPQPKKTRVLILGGGFGGCYAALHLDRTIGGDPGIEVALVSRENFLLFTPMLHEVAAGDLDAPDIVNPLRQILKHVKCLEADVESIDLGERRVTLTYGAARREREMSYDHLVIALGSETNFFGLPGVEERALTMKSLGDAFLLRSHTLAMLEMASLTEDAPAQRAMLTFVVAGGGFAGVETIGALNDLARDALEHYPGLSEDDLRLILVHPGEVILPELGDSLGRYAQAKLARRNVEVRLQTRVTAFSDRGVELENGEAIPAQILVWTAGVTPSSVLRSLPCKKEKGRVVVEETLEVPGFPGVWAVGDCAWVPNAQTGTAHPPTAQHALRESLRCAKNIVAAIRGTRKKAFAFTTLGQLASIGHRTGVAKIMGLHFSGLLAWWLWRSIYLAKLPRLEKKLRVALRWSLDLLFSRDLTQYVTMHGIEREQRRLEYIRQHQANPTPAARTLPAVATPGRQSGNGILRL